MNEINAKEEASKAAQLNEQLAYSKFRAAFQARNREQFKENMNQAESSYANASNLYEKGSLEALSKRSRARSLFAKFWIQDSNDERRVIIQQCITHAENAASQLKEQSEKRALADAHLDLIHYYAEVLLLSTELEEKKQLFEKTLRYGEAAIVEYENLESSKNLVSSIAITVGATCWNAEALLDPTSYEELGKRSRILSEKALTTAQQLGTPYELALANFALQAVSATVDRDWTKALASIKTGIALAKEVKDSQLVGELGLYGTIAAFWVSWGEEEDGEKATKILNEGISLASECINHLEIPLQRQEI